MKTETSQEIMEQIKTYVLLATKRMLTIDEVCLLTGYNKQCMYRLTSNREIPYYKPRKTTKKQPQA